MDLPTYSDLFARAALFALPQPLFPVMRYLALIVLLASAVCASVDHKLVHQHPEVRMAPHARLRKLGASSSFSSFICLLRC